MRKIKYKDLIRKFKAFSENEVVMEAYKGVVSFYDKEGTVRITLLVETDEEEHCYLTERNDL